MFDSILTYFSSLNVQLLIALETALNTLFVKTSIQSLLDEPNPNSPANSQAAQLFQENRREYEKKVMQIVEQSWKEV